MVWSLSHRERDGAKWRMRDSQALTIPHPECLLLQSEVDRDVDRDHHRLAIFLSRHELPHLDSRGRSFVESKTQTLHDPLHLCGSVFTNDRVNDALKSVLVLWRPVLHIQPAHRPFFNWLARQRRIELDSKVVPHKGTHGCRNALRNLERYVQNETFNNPQGGLNDPGATIQFDTKGVEFGPWLRRFIAQVRRNWFVPYAAMTFRGRVVLQFNIHKDGRITDISVVGPSDINAFNLAANNAILGSNPTEPLPPEYPDPRAFFTVTFYYNETPPVN